MSRWLVLLALAVSSSGTACAEEWMRSAACKPKLQDYYPQKAIRQGEAGAVLVEFRVKGKGHPEEVVVLRSTAPGLLQTAAILAISSMRCTPDQTWKDNGGTERRIRTNVLFKLIGVDETAERLDPDADQVVITGFRAKR